MPETFEKTEKLDSAYRLVIVAAKRSKELERGALPRVDSGNHKSTTIAIREVKHAKVNFELTTPGDEDGAGEE